MANKQKDLLEKILKGIEKAASAEGISPSEVTQTSYFAHNEDVTPWELRKMGGLTNIRKSRYPEQDKDLAIIRQEKEVVKYINQLEQKASERLVLDGELNKIIAESLRGLAIEKVKVEKPRLITGTKMTMESMISDVHYGKKTPNFNLKVCRERMQHLTTVFLAEMAKKGKEGYNVERIIVALLGDLIESYTMHGLESASGCEFGNSQQVQSAITSLFYDLLLPIGRTGVKVDVPAVTGNHDRTEHSRTMQQPGVNNLTWIIYKSLEEMCSIAGLKNVTFNIPTGSYVIMDIYNNKVLYEHGDNTKASTKKAFESLMEQRGRQNNVSLDFGRFGHYHEYACYDRGRIIVNESVCGQDSFAEVKGYNSQAGQTINFYVQTKNRPNSFYYSFPVALG